VRGGLALAVPGVVIGLVMTLVAARSIRSMIVGVGVSDPATLAGASALLLLIAVAACLLPAWRASRVDPITTLSAE
jgi:putative ABC transport system permease protein